MVEEAKSADYLDSTKINNDIMDVYLKKHSLDLKIIPNKNMIKLSDLRPMKSNTDSDECDDDDDDEGDEYDEVASSDDCVVVKKRRKKREPSLKLQQKLTHQDLEMIVNAVKTRQARVFIADVKKNGYVDKILKVESEHVKLSNGRSEALLKKSMFPKELNSLFDAFVSSLCCEDNILDQCGSVKPILKCLVEGCEFRSVSEAEINRHIKRHLAKDGFTCEFCARQFASMTNLQRHVRIHKGNKGKEVKCTECDYRAATITHVKRHMAHKHLERSLPCPHCTFMGATNAELKIHIARKHLELTGKNPLFLPKYLRKDYQCSICRVQFNDFKEYQNHTYEHTSSSNRFQCRECPYNCKNYSKLKRHMLYHMGARNFECHMCGNKFFQMEHLKRHLQSIHNLTPAEINSLNLSSSAGSEQQPSEKRSHQKAATSIKEKTAKSSTDMPPISTSSMTKVISKCAYKCPKCEQTCSKLFILNQHIINKHSKELVNVMSSGTTVKAVPPAAKTNEFGENSRIDEDETSEDDEDDDDEDESDVETDEMMNNHSKENFNNNQLNNFYLCAFCYFKTNKKSNLITHLKEKHADQVVMPIILPNDKAILDPNTIFECSNCSRLENSITEFVTHMNENHKAKVFLIDSNNQTKTLQEIVSGRKTTTPPITSLETTPTTPKTENKQPKLKAFYRHRKQYTMPQNERKLHDCPTVRINPHFLKTLNS